MGSDGGADEAADPQNEQVQVTPVQPEESSSSENDDPDLIPGIFRIRLTSGLQWRNRKWRSRRNASEEPGE
jgi:hypothetical protein